MNWNMNPSRRSAKAQFGMVQIRLQKVSPYSPQNQWRLDGQIATAMILGLWPPMKRRHKAVEGKGLIYHCLFGPMPDNGLLNPRDPMDNCIAPAFILNTEYHVNSSTRCVDGDGCYFVRRTGCCCCENSTIALGGTHAGGYPHGVQLHVWHQGAIAEGKGRGVRGSPKFGIHMRAWFCVT